MNENVKFLMKIESENVIFFRYCRDMNYDHKSEDMGYFYDVVYRNGNELTEKSGNVEEFEPIKEFLKKADEALIKKDEPNLNEMKLYNKNVANEVECKNGVVKYKGKRFRID